MMRTLLIAANRPKQYWYLALRHATLLRNVSPTKALTNSPKGFSPHQNFVGKNFDITKLHVWGTDAYVHVEKTIAHASSLVHVKVRTLGSTSHQTVTLCTSWTRSALYRPTTSQSMRRGAKFRQYTVWIRLQRTHIMRHQTASKAHQQHYSLQMSAVDIQRRIAQQRVCKVHHMQRPTCHRPRHLWTSATLFRHQRRWPLVPRKIRSPLRRTRGGDSSAQRREILRP